MNAHDPARTPEPEPVPADPPATRDAAAPANPVVCAACSNTAPDGARFCPACRTHLVSPDAGTLASPKRRLGAALLDEFVKDSGLLGPLLWPAVLPPGAARTMITVLTALYGALTLVLWTRGTTPAKRWLDLTVVTEDGEPAGFFRMAFRETIGKAISALAVGLGFLAIRSDPEHRGWHDRMAETWVVHDDDL